MIQLLFHLGHPLGKQLVCGTGDQLVRPHPVGDVLQQVPVHHCLGHIFKARGVETEGILLQPPAGKGRHLGEARVPQGAPHQVQIIGGPAGAAGLEQHDAGVIRVVLAAFQGLQHLADDHNGRVTHVVLYILQPQVDRIFLGGFRNHHLIAVPVQYVADKVEMDGRHLGR